MERRVLRSVFTKEYNALNELLNNDIQDKTEILARFESLCEKFDMLKNVDDRIYQDLLMKENVTDIEIEDELLKASEYSVKFYKIRGLVQSLDKPESLMESLSVIGTKRQVRLPKIELKKYDGDLKGWIGFWAQFSKIHTDDSLTEEDKFEYLFQCMKPNSPTYKLIEGFPPSKENYEKAIELLKSRFGKEELLIEYYVRELLNLVLKKESVKSIAELFDNLEAQLRALDSLGVTKEKYAAMLFPLVESVLPDSTFKTWDRYRVSKNVSTVNHSDCLAELLHFLKVEVEGEERLKLRKCSFENGSKGSSRIISKSKDIPSAATLVSAQNSHVKDKSCIFCDRTTHNSPDCAAVLDSSIDERSKVLKRKGACFKCLRTGHRSSTCRVFVKCALCKKPHYPIMCPSVNKNDNASMNEKEAEIVNTLAASSQSSISYLQTLIVYVIVEDRKIPVRVLCDSGSQRSYIQISCAKKCSLIPHSKIGLSQVLFGGKKMPFQTYDTYRVKLSDKNSKNTSEFNLIGSDKICTNVPKVRNDKIYLLLKSKGIIISDYSDEDTDNFEEIQVLLGADAWAKIVTSDVVSVEKDLLAIRTTLGWTLIGTWHDPTSVFSNMGVSLTCSSEISQFWKLETLGIFDPVEKIKQEEKDKEVAKFFEETTKRNGKNGRYVVRLPWIGDHPPLQSNRDVALKRLQITSKKLKKVNKFKDYDDVIKDWLSKEIIELVPESNGDERIHYLPHRAVFKESTTTKIRPVFDASNKDANGFSLNDCLEVGPNLLDLIPIVLTNFRIYPVALTSDIEKAFLQIELDPTDRDFLRFFWWDNDKIIEFRHCRVVFGVCSSPFLLSACLNDLLENPPEHFTNITKKLKGTFYMDNCLSGVSEEKDVEPFIKKAIELMSSAGFNLRGWKSSVDVEDSPENVLGLQWYRPSDELGCRILTWNDASTRRMLLSCIQKIYDPIGFSAPALLVPKIILQKTWKLKIDWDEVLPKEIQNEFIRWTAEAHYLKDCRIPRRIIINSSSSLHVFCDASKSAYGVCIFLRTEENGEVFLYLVLAKSRLAPLKQMTLPRLELIAALLGVRLYQLAIRCLNIENLETTFWSDASVVLAWLKKRNTWSVFVENRVREIQENSKLGSWKHVPGILNPSDVLSRGCYPLQLLKSQWWTGPEFLKKSPEFWPSSDPDYDTEEIDKEKRRTVTSAKNSTIETILTKLASRFSKYSMIVRTIAWMLRFRPTRFRKEIYRENITSEEFEKAEKTLFYLIQNDAFDEEQRKSDLKNLQVFLDEDGILRMKSRVLDTENLQEYTFPIILPSTNVIVLRMIEQLHLEHKHAGIQTLLMIVRERFWILKGRKTVRFVVKRCVICQRNAAKAFEVPLPPLPEDRTKMVKTFQVTGIDLAGPVFLKGRVKSWIVIFTCAVFRAVHLELITSLSTCAFMEAFRRFIARRGRVEVVYSDNGSNFVGLNNAMNQLDWAVIENESSLMKIKWKFNPPTASWWGGFWERLIRILKDLLRKNLGHASLRYEEFLTLLCECESLMNNRPLTYFSEDGEDLVSLKPSMFIQSLTGNNVHDLDEIQSVNLTERWRYLQRVREALRNRFKKEYLGFLRSYQQGKRGKIKVGDIVLIGSDNKKRMDWMLARVVELLPGKDKIIRLVKLKTSSGMVLRPIQRLFPIEIDSDSEKSPFTANYDKSVISSFRKTRYGREVHPPRKLNL